MTDCSKFQKSDRVYNRHNPGRQGVLTGKTRSRADDVFYQVEFDDGFDYMPVYELEKVMPKQDSESLIERGHFGRVSDLRRNLTHIQLSGKLASFAYSLDITNTDFYPHQFKPVFAFLESPSHGLLIADEVGLGKTIEAGLIWTELRARYDDRRVLVVCPAMLREKWRDELRNRFGVEAAITDAAGLLDELKRNNIPDGKGIICSMQGIRPPSDWKEPVNSSGASNDGSENRSGSRYELADFVADQSNSPPIIDLLIIDEAHYLRNPASRNAHLGKMLRDISKNVLLLSATPINLRSDDLFHLLEIVDEDTFFDRQFFSQILQANEPLLKARRQVLDTRVGVDSVRQSLKEAAERPVFVGSLQLKRLRETLEDPKSMDTDADRTRLADGIDRVNLLRHVVNRTRKAEVIEMKVVRVPVSQFVELADEESKLYGRVTEAIRAYAKQNKISYGFLLANPQRQISSCMYAAAKSWKDRAYGDSFGNMVYEDMGSEVDDERDVAPLMSYLAKRVLPKVDLQKLYEHDSKFEKFYNGTKSYFEQYSSEKIVVFSYFRATLFYLEERLIKHNIASQVLTGGMKESKQAVIERFRTDQSIKVLLSSEVASEGVDLQFCRLIVNYDLPWNPMKIEQRIGRLDRIGQQADKISIWNFGHAGTIDHSIYERLFVRLNIFQRALGEMESILGEKIKVLTDDFFGGDLTPEQQEEQLDKTAIAIENKKNSQNQLEKDASRLIAHSGYILNRAKKAHEDKKRITEDDLVVYIKDYLDKYSQGHEFYQPDSEKLRFDIKLSATMAADLARHIETENRRGQTRLAAGDRVKCEFVNQVGPTGGNVERIGQFHPLIRFIGKKIKDEGFFPVVAIKLDQNQKSNDGRRLPDGQYAFAIQKWVFTGLRDEEDIRVRAMYIAGDGDSNIQSGTMLNMDDSQKLLDAARLGGFDWPEAKTAVNREDLNNKIFSCVSELKDEFERVRSTKHAENVDRIELQVNSVSRHRDRQIEVQSRVLENYEMRDKTRMIPAIRGRIEKIKSRFETQIEKLKINKNNITSDNPTVCCGALLLKQKTKRT